jgi:hypoxanthine phosphoribosyltransferase
MEKQILTYQEYGQLLYHLVKKIKYSPILDHIKYVYGIPRGGLPIVAHLSHFLNLRYIDDPNYAYESTMIVDDIADTGITLKEFEGVNIASATLFYKRRSSVKPTFYVEETDKWIVFPWERTDEIPNRD